MTRELKHIFILTVTIILTYLSSRINLTTYDIPIAVTFFIILFIVKKTSLPSGGKWNIIESCLFTFIIMFTVFTTGSANSPFFFLIYFLVFSLSLLLEPIVSLSSTLLITFIFVFSSPANMPFKTILPIFSLAFLAPFAMILSQERSEIEKLKLTEQSEKENAFLFLSLTIKKHLETISDIINNFNGEKDITIIKKQIKIMEKLIEKYEKDAE